MSRFTVSKFSDTAINIVADLMDFSEKKKYTTDQCCINVRLSPKAVMDIINDLEMFEKMVKCKILSHNSNLIDKILVKHCVDEFLYKNIYILMDFKVIPRILQYVVQAKWPIEEIEILLNKYTIDVNEYHENNLLSVWNYVWNYPDKRIFDLLLKYGTPKDFRYSDLPYYIDSFSNSNSELYKFYRKKMIGAFGEEQNFNEITIKMLFDSHIPKLYFNNFVTQNKDRLEKTFTEKQCENFNKIHEYSNKWNVKRFCDKYRVLLENGFDPNPHFGGYELSYKSWGKIYKRNSFMFIFIRPYKDTYLLDQMFFSYMNYLKPNQRTIEDLEFLISMGKKNLSHLKDNTFTKLKATLVSFNLDNQKEAKIYPKCLIHKK